jgi:hypothetical protein
MSEVDARRKVKYFDESLRAFAEDGIRGTSNDIENGFCDGIEKW